MNNIADKKETIKAYTAAANEALSAIEAGKAFRRDMEDGGRLHIDRPLPFLCLYQITGADDDSAAREVASANASYLMTPDMDVAEAVGVIGAAMTDRFGTFIVLEVGELERDRLLEDAPYLPPFEITLSSHALSSADALTAFRAAVEGSEAQFRTPRIQQAEVSEKSHSRLNVLLPNYPSVTVRFAPIYRSADTGQVYPELRRRLVANIVDAGLQAVAAFLRDHTTMPIPTHRALGRRAFVDAVERADRSIDEVARAFDLLLAVTPINADNAWREFSAGMGEQEPRFLYRPLSMQVEVEKRKLFSIAFGSFEDPVLYDLYREKQQELDLQLSMISARQTRQFVEIGRALYGPVEAALLEMALDILANTRGRRPAELAGQDVADCYAVESAARSMIGRYQQQNPGFEPQIELRDDIPPGLMVSGSCLLISRRTSMDRRRIQALLSHEIGVHLLTHYNGSAQGLRLFSSGLAGYEAAQEGLAVFAEYLVGGMTVGRLRQLAARVVACSWMLNGAAFVESHRMLVQEFAFSELAAFNIVVRLYRGGGLAKDAMYLRGLLQILDHIRSGGELGPFWMGKISASHFGVMQELNSRGLLKAPQIEPQFLHSADAQIRMVRARSGLSPIEMIQN